jgi:7-carboxy-7-deazaguanine synthase
MTSEIEKRYAIAETFDSVQGEGAFTGAAMSFIRLAGCHIGGKSAICRFADGREFACDTDYKARRSATASDLAREARFHHVCITGGEPLDHDIVPLLQALKQAGKFVHIETSGAIEAPEGIDWITVSPKHGCLDSMLRRANQVKLLVDERFDPVQWRARLESAGSQALVYVQPINEKTTLHDANLVRAFDLTQTNSDWRVTVQLHKVLQVR